MTTGNLWGHSGLVRGLECEGRTVSEGISGPSDLCKGNIRGVEDGEGSVGRRSQVGVGDQGLGSTGGVDQTRTSQTTLSKRSQTTSDTEVSPSVGRVSMDLCSTPRGLTTPGPTPSDLPDFDDRVWSFRTPLFLFVSEMDWSTFDTFLLFLRPGIPYPTRGGYSVFLLFSMVNNSCDTRLVVRYSLHLFIRLVVA